MQDVHSAIQKSKKTSTNNLRLDKILNRNRNSSPFTDNILNAETRPNFQPPKFKIYDPTFGDPCKHISAFENRLALVDDDNLFYRLFPSTFENVAIDWFEELPSKCIAS